MDASTYISEYKANVKPSWASQPSKANGMCSESEQDLIERTAWLGTRTTVKLGLSSIYKAKLSMNLQVVFWGIGSLLETTWTPLLISWQTEIRGSIYTSFSAHQSSRSSKFIQKFFWYTLALIGSTSLWVCRRCVKRMPTNSQTNSQVDIKGFGISVYW